MLKGTFRKLTLYILLTLLSTAGAAYFFAIGKTPLGVLACLPMLLGVFRLYRLYSQDKRKLAFMFNSVENDDYSFNFTTLRSSTSDILLNNSLNRIKELMINAKLDVVQKEKYYELIMNSVATGIIVTNESGSIYQHNDAALKIIGLQVLTHINQLAKIEEKLPAAFASIMPGEQKQVSFHNERGEINLSLSATTLQVQDRALKIIALSDIGGELDERELESWVRLTRVLTHEIMNSITPITALSDALIGLYGSRGDKISDGLDVINSTSKGLISFVESYRKFTRIPPPERTLFYVGPLLSRIGSLSEIDPEINLSSEDIIIYADENQISQVMLNLVKNASEASVHLGGDARVKLDVFLNDDEHVIIEVSDNGGGIPPEIAENIFVPFFTTKEGGSGIGLSISRQIMKLHNGTLAMRTNLSAGKGDMTTTFILTFK